MGVKLNGNLTYDIVVTLNVRVLKCSANSTKVSNAPCKYVIILLVALILNICVTFRSKI